MATTPVKSRSGWVTTAGVVMLVAGGYNALSGIAAISDDDTLKAQATKVLYGIDIGTWGDRKSTRLNSSHHTTSRMPSSA